MSLIEHLGGYEKAKESAVDLAAKLTDKQKNNSIFMDALNALNEELLEYRRQHNIYEKGDWVFYEVTGCIGDFIDHIKLDGGHPYCRVDFGLCDVGLIMLKHIRHAKDEELKAGKRSSHN